MHNFSFGKFTLVLGLITIILIMFLWWRDVIRESTFLGYHTKKVQQGLRLGVILFIISEAMLFFSFFRAFFHSSLSPSVVLGSVWPPIGINVLNPLQIPLLNTLILLLSGLTVTLSHHIIRDKNWQNIFFLLNKYSNSILKTGWSTIGLSAKMENDNMHVELKTIIADIARSWFINWNVNDPRNFIKSFSRCYLSLLVTILLGIEFTFWQAYEYYKATFYIYDGIYGSTFYMTTGLHGLHVIVGTIFLMICLFRLLNWHFTYSHHLGYEAAIRYWHFVDVVWIFLFLTIYCWGSGLNSFYK
jgi:heme/copper-type cytochrome/quinol oxidase subunit 3